MAGCRDAVHGPASVVVAFKCVAKTQETLISVWSGHNRSKALGDRPERSRKGALLGKKWTQASAYSQHGQLTHIIQEVPGRQSLWLQLGTHWQACAGSLCLWAASSVSANQFQPNLWMIPEALWMATRPLPSLDWPSLRSRAYMFFSEKLQPWKSKWAEFKEMSFGYSIFSTC